MNKYEKTKISKIVTESSGKPKIKLLKENIEKLKNIAGVILGLLAVGGITSVALIAPNVLQLINKASWAKKTYSSLFSKKPDQQKKIIKSFYYLKRTGLVKLIKKGSDFEVRITKKGKVRVEKIAFVTLKVPVQKNWDKKWWLVLADIPQNLKLQADLFRKKIKEMSFYPLQRTVWLHTFDPRKEIAFLSTHYGLERFVTVMQVNELEESDEELMTEFFKKLNYI